MVNQYEFRYLVSALGMWLLIVSCTASLKEEVRAPTQLLQTGWQFFGNPTTLEPPGTVFRIDSQGRRFLVTVLSLDIKKGLEAAGRKSESVTTTGEIFLRFLKLRYGGRGELKKQAVLEFEMMKPERESTTDLEVDHQMKSLFAKVELRRDSRYFIIRETRSAAGMHFKLDEAWLNQLGGEVVLSTLFSAGSGFHVDRRQGYVLSQDFPISMRVMYLPEEIIVAGAGLGGAPPRLGRKPVAALLEWNQGEDARVNMPQIEK